MSVSWSTQDELYEGFFFKRISCGESIIKEDMVGYQYEEGGLQYAIN